MDKPKEMDSDELRAWMKEKVDENPVLVILDTCPHLEPLVDKLITLHGAEKLGDLSVVILKGRSGEQGALQLSFNPALHDLAERINDLDFQLRDIKQRSMRKPKRVCWGTTPRHVELFFLHYGYRLWGELF
jgi:hypothetical protein